MKQRLAVFIIGLFGSAMYGAIYWLLPFGIGGGLLMVGVMHLSTALIAALIWAIKTLDMVGRRLPPKGKCPENRPD